MTRYISLAVLILAGCLCRSFLFGLFTPQRAKLYHTIPADFPNDVPVYPNYKLDGASKIAGSFVLELTAKSDAKTVLSYYQQQLSSYGWQVSNAGEEESEDGDGTGITATKENRGIAIFVTHLSGGDTAVSELVR